MANEAKVLAAVKTMLKTHPKCLVIRITNTTGMPDLIACVNGRFLGIEVKDDKNGSYGMTKAQRIRLAQIIAAGGIGCCVDKNNVEAFRSLIEKLQVEPQADVKFWGWSGKVGENDKA